MSAAYFLLGGMKGALKVAVGVLATIGAAYVVFGIYAAIFLMDCEGAITAQARSPNANYYAIYRQKRCKDPAKSRSQVELSGAKEKTTFIVLEIEGTSDVDLMWKEDRELQVIIPESATIKKRYAPMANWPLITEKRK